jgi:hypothetical protein
MPNKLGNYILKQPQLHVFRTLFQPANIKYNAWSTKRIEVFTPESKEISLQFSAVICSFMGMNLVINEVWHK